MKSLAEKLRSPDYNGLGMNQTLLNQAALNIEALEADYANLLAERDALFAELEIWKQSNVTADELKLIIAMRGIREKNATLRSDWPEDIGQHPQRGLAK